MKSLLCMFRIICLLCSLVLASGAIADQEPEKLKMRELRVSKNGVALILRIAKTSLVEQPINLEISLRNETKSKLIHGVNGYSDWNLVVKDERGETVPLTRFGQRWLVGSKINASSTRALAPGASYSTTLNLARPFDLSVGGTYQVSVRCSVNDFRPDQVILESTPITFEVIESPPE